MKKSKVSSKKRDFAFLLYPESVVSNWKEVLAQLQQPVFWILHDKDMIVDDNTGKMIPKKPHYHVQIMFDSPRSAKFVSEVAVKCGGNGHLEEIVSRKGYARYLTHMDSLDKHRYDEVEVHKLCGADYEKETKSRTELKSLKTIVVTDIFQFIDDNQIHIYADLLRYCANDKPEWLEILLTYAGHVVKDYIRSEAYDFKDKHPNRHYNRFYFD